MILNPFHAFMPLFPFFEKKEKKTRDLAAVGLGGYEVGDTCNRISFINCLIVKFFILQGMEWIYC